MYTKIVYLMFGCAHSKLLPSYTQYRSRYVTDG
jgi:hypothetical protein